MILLARVLLFFFSPCISSLSPKSGSNHGRTFAGSLLFSFVAKYPTNFHGKDRTGQHWAQGWFFIIFKSRFQDVDNKEINQISFIKCCRCVQKIVGQCNLFELMVAISDLTLRWSFTIFVVIIHQHRCYHYHQRNIVITPIIININMNSYCSILDSGQKLH